MKSTIQLQQDPLSCTWESFIETGSSTQQDELTQRLNQNNYRIYLRLFIPLAQRESLKVLC